MENPDNWPTAGTPMVAADLTPLTGRVSWVLVPCLAALRAEFDQLAPDRDRRSDGSVGDPAHAATSSDHNPDETGRTPFEDADNINEVHAIDVDDDLDPWRPDLMEQAVQRIVARHRSGFDDRLQNVIYRRRIWSRTWGWTEQPYTGTSPHDGHAHFSSRYASGSEADTNPWGVATLGADTVTKEQFIAWMTAWADSPGGQRALTSAAAAAVDARVGDVVPRLGPDRKPLPDTDDNPTMGVGSALFYLARDAADIKEALTTHAAPQSRATAPTGKATTK